MSSLTMKLKKVAVKRVDDLGDVIFKLNRQMHAHPETRFKEFRAMSILSEALDQNGFKVERGIASLDTAFQASFNESQHESPIITLMAEYDALPKLGHACGHNMIGSAAVGAALALRPIMKDVEGTIQVIGTPGEEGGGGKVILIEAGFFEPVDVAMMVHPWNITASGTKSLARVKIDIQFRGKPAHSFMHQDQGANALAATIQTFNGVNALREHLRPRNSMVHGIITHGGDSALIVPDYSAANFFILAPDIEYAREIYRKVKNCAEGSAKMTGTQVSFDAYEEYKDLRPNLKLVEAFDQNLEMLGLEIDKVGEYDAEVYATDAGDVSHKVPTIQPFMCMDKELIWHTPEVAMATVSENGKTLLLNMAKALAMTAIDLYTRPDLIKGVQEEFKLKIAGRKAQGESLQGIPVKKMKGGKK